MNIRQLLVGGSIAAVLVLSACSDDDNGEADDTGAQDTTASGDTTGATGDEPAIVIAGFEFTVSDASTGTITVRNDDSTTHTATAVDGAFDLRLGPGETGSFELTEAGSYAFACQIHPAMTGTLTVN